MRKTIYQALLKAPFRVGSAGIGIGGIVGSVWPEKVQKVIGGDTLTIQGVGIALLAAAAIYFALLWLLKPGGSAPQVEPQSAPGPQTTLGHQSPIFRDVHGNVTINPPPAETQVRKSPYGSARSPWDDPNFSLLNRPPQQDYPLAGRRQEYPLSPHQGPRPDMELREVCDRLYDSLGGPPELIADFEARLERKIKDGVRHWRLHTWGRKNDPNAGLDGVWGDAWLKGKLDHAKGSLRFRHPDNPRSVHEWTDLHFNREEVDEWLPPKSGRNPITGY